jgi:hypothetical protein
MITLFCNATPEYLVDVYEQHGVVPHKTLIIKGARLFMINQERILCMRCDVFGCTKYNNINPVSECWCNCSPTGYIKL